MVVKSDKIPMEKSKASDITSSSSIIYSTPFCTLSKLSNLFILTLTGTDEHRLNPTLIDSIRSALSHTLTTNTPSALITTAHGKFFSNGYDLTWGQSDPTRHKIMSKKLRLLISDIISLPMPTIAVVTGHASAAGFILALSHDYLIMRGDRGFLYMSELDIGMKVPEWFVEVLKRKVGSGKVVRDLVLQAKKVTGEVGVNWGVVDCVCVGEKETVEMAVRMGEEIVRKGWDGRVYRENRETVFGNVVRALGTDETVGDFGEGGSKGVSRL